MSKTEKENPQKLEMPSAWATQIAVIHKRIEKLRDDYIESKRGKNYATDTLNILKSLTNSIEKKYKKKPPRTLADGQKYALSRSFQATYFALMDKDGNLVKTLIVNKGEILSEIPKYSMIEKEVTVTMKAKFIVIPDLKFERTIPKRVVKAVPFACNPEKEEISEYQA